MDYLSRTEELLLLAVWKLQDEAYGLAVRRHLSKLLGKEMSVGAVYVPLERLVRNGLLETWESEPTQKRGGRRKRFYRLTPQGMAALNAVKQLQESAWQNLPSLGLNLAS